MYFAMVQASKRKPVEGDKGFKHGLFKRTKEGHFLGNDATEHSKAHVEGAWSKGQVPDYAHQKDQHGLERRPNHSKGSGV